MSQAMAQGKGGVGREARRQSAVVWVVMLLVVFSFCRVSGAATAYYSFTGAFTNGTETQSFLFNLNSALRPPAPFTLRTWHYGGGTNATGDTIAAGGFDPILRLYDDTPTLEAENDDFSPPTVRDSLIDWSTSGMPLQLPADGYQLNLVAYNNTLGGRTGNWAVDLLADAAKFTLTGVAKNDGTGATTVNSLAIGSDDIRLPAKVQVGPLTNFSIVGPLIVGDTGSGEITVTTGALNTDNGVLGYSNSYLGFEPASVGNVTLKLGGSWSDNQGINTVGWQGDGNLRIESGALASFEGPVVLGEYWGSEGNVTVTGHDSYLVTNSAIDVGEGGTGYLRIENEGHVSSTGFWTVGADTVGVWGQGTVEVDGKDSLWSSGKLIVGYGNGMTTFNRGTVRITNGGRIATTGNSHIGYYTYANDSSITLTGAAPDGTRSTWAVSGNLYLAGDEFNPSNAANSKLAINPGGFVDVAGTTTVWNGGGSLELLGGEMETGSLIVKPSATFTHNDGTLTINGGTFDPGTGSGIYAITGADITDRPKVVLASGAQGALGGLAWIGHDNYGELAIEGGAVLNAASDVAVARAESAPASGKLTVAGAGSRLVVTAPVSSSLAIGANGPGELFVTAGGQVQVTQGSVSLACCWDVGGAGSGQITIEDENSRLEAGFLNFRASASDSRVTIRNEGRVHATDVTLASQIWPASSHRIDVEVIDANSRLQVDGDVLWVLGDEGGGTANLEIRNGGSAHAAGEVWLDGYRATGVALISIDGGMAGNANLTVGRGLYVGGDSTHPSSGIAKLTVGHNGSVNASTVTVWQPGTVELNAGSISTGGFLLAGGTLRGNGSISLGSALTNSGTVSPGLSAGALSINGNYVQETAGTLAIEIGGTAPAQFDRLLVSGSASLHGTLQVSLIDPLGGPNVYAPQSGDSFKFLTAAGGLDSATFDNYVWPTLPGGLYFGALYDHMDSSVSLKVVGVLGDYNHNDVVDAADYVLWRETYRGPNVPPPSLAADGDGDGDVDQNDWNVWRAHFGQVAPPIVSAVGSVADVIPEPAVGWLVVLGAALLVCRRTATKPLRMATTKHRLEFAGAMRIMISIGMSAVAISVSAATLFRDDFNGSLNSAWSIVRPDASYYSVQPTYLDVRCSDGDIWAWRTDAKNLFLIDNPTAGDFAVTLKVNSFAPTVNFAQIDILAYDDDDNHVRPNYGYLSGKRRLDNAGEIAGAFSGHGLTDYDFANSPFWLQMRKVGTVYSLFYSIDGLVYSPASTSFAYGDGTPQKLGFVAMVDPNQNTHALVDSFTVTQLILAGDYSGNGVVDAADYVVWRTNLNTNNVLPNDPIGGTIGPAQYATWRSHFGQTVGSGAVLDSANAADAIPEPSAILLLGLGVSVCVLTTRRKRTLGNEIVRFADGR